MLGSIEDVQACNEAEPIGFTPGCAEWYVIQIHKVWNCCHASHRTSTLLASL
jgi:hypothetical protein